MANRQRWECVSVQRKFNEVPDNEIRERLAEVLGLLLNKGSQLQKDNSFSGTDLSSFDRQPRFLSKQKRTEKSA